MPVLGCVRCENVDQAIDWAVWAERGCWHSALMHSTNYLNMTKAARALNTTIFVKNGPSTAGLGFNGEGICDADHCDAHRRGTDLGPQLHAGAPLRAGGWFPHHLTGRRLSGCPEPADSFIKYEV